MSELHSVIILLTINIFMVTQKLAHLSGPPGTIKETLYGEDSNLIDFSFLLQDQT